MHSLRLLPLLPLAGDTMGMRDRPKQLYSTSWSATVVLPEPVAPLMITPRRLLPADIESHCVALPGPDEGSRCDVRSRNTHDLPQKNCESISSC